MYKEGINIFKIIFENIENTIINKMILLDKIRISNFHIPLTNVWKNNKLKNIQIIILNSLV